MGLVEWGFLAAVLVVLGLVAKITLSRRLASISSVQNQVPADGGSKAGFAPSVDVAHILSTETALIGPDGKTLLSVAFMDEATFKRSQPVALQPLEVDRLSPILQLAPDFATAAKVAGSNLYHVVIGGDMIAAKGLPDALRPMAKAANGDFSELALLYRTEALSSLVSSGLILNIASMALAQKHLADINAKLEALQTSISAISWFQNAERRASVEGALRYFREISGPMGKGEQPWTFQQQLEAHYAALLATEQHLALDIEHRATQTIPSLKDSGQWGTEVFRSTIDKETADLEDIMDQWFLCIRAKLQAWCLQALVPGNNETKRARLESIRTSVEDMKGPDGLLSDAIKAITSKIDEINSKVELADTLSRHRKSLREKLAGRATALWQALDETELMVLRAAEISSDAAGPLSMALRVVDGRVVEARALSHEPNVLNALSQVSQKFEIPRS